MKRILLFLIYFLFAGTTFSQVESNPPKLTDSEYYTNGEVMAKSVFDSLTKKWKKTEYYLGGAIAKESMLEKNGFTFTDTSKIFFINGNLAYKTTWKENTLTGEFIECYPDGKIKRQGEYFNFFKTGLWTEYYKNGKRKVKVII
jgi:antitoxin component YwqK of YwqJK toxin-antitoxin module